MIANDTRDTDAFHANLPTEQDVLDALKASEKKEDIFLNLKEEPELETASVKTDTFDSLPVIAPEETTEPDDSVDDVPASKPASKKAKKTTTRNKTENYSNDYFLPTSIRKKVMKDKKVNLQAQSLAPKALEKKLALITTLILDVDGVLTDGSIYITDQGTGLKRFNSQDGFGMKMLMANGIQVVLLSARQCKATRKRARELGIEQVNLGVKDKKTFLQEHMKNNRLLSSEVAYVGDDLVDFPAMMECGVKIMPANGVIHMSKAMDYTTRASGGQGAVREVCDIILIAQGLYQQYLQHS